MTNETTGSKTLSDAIFSQYEPTVVPQLIEFTRHLSRLDVDALIFMARKSLCLYDVLTAVGCERSERLTLSDRILDLSLDQIKGKRIALVDDTLIVGTTLAKAKQKLKQTAGCSVSTHVFCLDKLSHVPQLITPDYVAVEMDDSHIMSFCNATVKAMSILPRPYIVDFPLSRDFRIKETQMQMLLGSIDWLPFRITTPLQEAHDIDVYTFLPSAGVAATLSSLLGSDVAQCLDIIKIRAFCRRVDDVYWFKIVPIVTLHPLHEEDIVLLFDALLTRIHQHTYFDIRRLSATISTPIARQRVIQFVLGAALGEAFTRGVCNSIDMPLEYRLDDNELMRHFGPSIYDDMLTLTTGILPCLEETEAVGILHFVPVQITEPIQESNELEQSLLPIASDDISNRRNDVVDLIANFSEIFLNLFRTTELPARDEAKRLGAKLLDPNIVAPLLDRLERGVTWSQIRTFLRNRLKEVSDRSEEVLSSLVLDICNDLGIAVPITCCRDGIVHRAFRHGEDVRFTDNELVLAHDIAKGLLKGSHNETIPHLTLEKMLAILIRVGAACNFLEPFYGHSGTDGTVRIAYHLKGAVPMLYRGPKYRADREMWLSQYLVRRKVIVKEGESKLYRLGVEPSEGTALLPRARSQAEQLGYLLGRCLATTKYDDKKKGPLDDKSLILLATCTSSRDTAAAIQAELDIFQEWFKYEGVVLVQKIKWHDVRSVEQTRARLIKSVGYEALHSARLKFCGYQENAGKSIVQRCGSFLSESDLEASMWRSYWESAFIAVPAEKQHFDPLLKDAAALVWSLYAAIATIEIFLTAKDLSVPESKRQTALQYAIKKLTEYNEAMEQFITIPAFVQRITKRLNMITGELDEIETRQIGPWVVKTIQDTLRKAEKVIAVLEPMILSYGKLRGKHTYKYMLYYDIQDSTATRVSQQTRNVVDARNATSEFTEYIKSGLRKISVLAGKKKGEVFPWGGSIDSDNDGKHIFFSGKWSTRNIYEVLQMLVDGLKAVPSVKIRVCIVPCNFSSGEAFRYGNDPEVGGNRFWEHCTRLLEKCKELENSLRGSASALFIAGEPVISQFRTPEGVQWSEVQDVTIMTQSEGLNKSTSVRYGQLMPSFGRN